ncbi:hypothetical protein [Hyalangium rubrum]|uniref:Uncharacterized protein n=1 Tax=Hyalangium rubrum TaxID=3103134 RepID=A0ABU5HI15_9BACT|nr:hypothetical protein [Hyalangium sp. s54d21]MDY7233106.1 hypothetical protein [Hyalangium sp. s54d21]
MPASTYDRIVIGAGTTAAVYLSFFPPREHEKVGVIGTPEPWAKRGHHQMGQPPPLLMLPLEEPDRPEGFDPHTSRTPLPSLDRPPQEPFLRSDRFARQIPLNARPDESMGQFANNKYRHAWVESVTWVIDRFKVSYRYAAGEKAGRTKYLYARQVIAASGPGPASQTQNYDEAAPLGVYHTGDGYLNEQVAVRGKAVAVEGGSATAAWSVEKALLGGANHVFWFTRPGEDKKGSKDLVELGAHGLARLVEARFSAAFPAGDRNLWLKRCPAITQIVGTLKAKWSTQEQRLILAFDSGLNVAVDQYVAAVGASETAPYLGELRNGLKAIVDTEGHLHPSGNAILGYTGHKGQLLVVGAGTFKMDPKKVDQHPKFYAQGNEYLPTAARPPEGIPTIIASIATLTRYLTGGGSRWLDINLGNFSDLDVHFSEGIARAFAQVALQMTHGFSLERVTQFLTDQVIGTRIMKSSPYGITLEEMIALYQNLRTMFQDGTHLQHLITAYSKRGAKKE